MCLIPRWRFKLFLSTFSGSCSRCRHSVDNWHHRQNNSGDLFNRVWTQVVLVDFEGFLIWFLLLLRLLCSPLKTKFFIQPMNLIDFLSLLPFYISLVFIALEDFSDIGKAGKIIRLIKVILSILKKWNLWKNELKNIWKCTLIVPCFKMASLIKIN